LDEAATEIAISVLTACPLFAGARWAITRMGAARMNLRLMQPIFPWQLHIQKQELLLLVNVKTATAHVHEKHVLHNDMATSFYCQMITQIPSHLLSN